MGEDSLSQVPPKMQAPEREVTYLDPALWRQLAEAASAEDFCQSWLILQSRMLGGVRCGLVLLGPPDTGPFQPVATWPLGYPGVAQLAPVIEKTLKEQKGVVIKPPSPEGPPTVEDTTIHLAYPVKVRERLCGAAVFQISLGGADELHSIMRQVQWGVAWLENWVLRQEAEDRARILTRLTTVLDLAAATLQESHFKAAATTFVTLLATRMFCDRVSVGFLKKHQVKVEVLSHSAKFGQELNLIRAIGEAMDECLDQGKTIRYPEAGEADGLVRRAHETLAKLSGANQVLTIPFLDNEGQGYGALTLEWAAAQPSDGKTVELCEAAAALIGPILLDKRQKEEPLYLRAWELLRAEARALLGPRHTVRKGIALALMLAAIFFSFATGEYRVTAEAVLEGVVQRALVAPFAGFVKEAPVRPGDVVQADQVLCSLDDRDLRLERLKWLSQKQQLGHKLREAMAEGDPAKMNIVKEQINQAEAQLALVEEQLSRVAIRAPFEGVVITGDLSHSLGAPVERGQVLFEVAPLHDYRITLHVDERDISHIKAGQSGGLILTALPGETLPFVVEKVMPVSRVKEGRNYFQVEGKLLESRARLRPGMEGYAKIFAGRRKLFWIWTHSFFDWLRLKLWTWLP